MTSLVMTKYFLYEGGNKTRKGEIFARGLLSTLLSLTCCLQPRSVKILGPLVVGVFMRDIPGVCYPSLCTQKQSVAPPTKEREHFNRRLLRNSLKVLLTMSWGTRIWSNITLCLQRKFFDAKFPSLSAYFVLWAAARRPRGNSENVISCHDAKKRTAMS